MIEFFQPQYVLFDEQFPHRFLQPSEPLLDDREESPADRSGASGVSAEGVRGLALGSLRIVDMLFIVGPHFGNNGIDMALPIDLSRGKAVIPVSNGPICCQYNRRQVCPQDMVQISGRNRFRRTAGTTIVPIFPLLGRLDVF